MNAMKTMNYDLSDRGYLVMTSAVLKNSYFVVTGTKLPPFVYVSLCLTKMNNDVVRVLISEINCMIFR